MELSSIWYSAGSLAGLVTIVFCLTYFAIQWFGFLLRRKYLNAIPTQERHWLWGHLHLVSGPNEEALKLVRLGVTLYRNGRIGCSWYGPIFGNVVLGHPQTVKLLLKTTEPKPHSFGGYKLAKPWLGDGLLLTHGKKWNRNRRLLTPAFHFDILKPYTIIDNKAAGVFLGKLQHFSQTGEYFNICDHISLLTLDILLRCAFSYENDCQTKGQKHPYVKAVSYLTNGMMERILKPWLFPDWIYFMTASGKEFLRMCDYVHSVAEEVIKRRKAEMDRGETDETKRGYMDFLDILLKAKDNDGQGLTNQEIRDEVDTFLFEGHDTTASGLSWVLYRMALHPEHMTRCQEEVDQVLRGREDDTITWEDLPKLTYLSQCIKETMRIHPPVPFIERQTTKDMYIDGHYIQAGTVVDLHLYAVHHNPVVWQDSLEYRPERFSPENLDKMDSHAFIPFSAGPRNCIGQHFAMHEMKVITARILHRFNLQLKPGHSVRQWVSVVMKTENGILMTATPRTHTNI